MRTLLAPLARWLDRRIDARIQIATQRERELGGRANLMLVRLAGSGRSPTVPANDKVSAT